MTQGTTAQQGAQPQQSTQQPPQGTQVQAVSQNAMALKRMGEETVSTVLERVNTMKSSGELVLADGYNVGNALNYDDGADT